MTLNAEGTDQVFELPSPVQARYLKVLFQRNAGGSYLEAGEVQVMGSLIGAGDTAPARTNWASKANGGAIVKFTSQYNDSTWAAANLIDGGNSVGASWGGYSNAAQEIFIKLDAPEQITDLAVNTYAPESPSNWATQVEVLTSEQHAHKGFVSHGKMEIPLDGDWHVLSLPQPIRVSYLKVVFLKNGGGSYMEAGEVRAYGP
jgi:F5/8 type C domain